MTNTNARSIALLLALALTGCGTSTTLETADSGPMADDAAPSPSDAGPLAAPIVTLTARGATSTEAAWTSIAGATDYTLEQSTEETFATASVTSNVTSESAIRTGLASGTRYYARVRANARDGRTSPWSETVSAVTSIDGPTDVAITATSDSARPSTDACWVTPASSVGSFYAVQVHASATCPAGTTAQFNFRATYTSPVVVVESGWRGPDACMERPYAPYGVRWWVTARCATADATSEVSAEVTTCYSASGGC